MASININIHACQFQSMLGVGGIGTGVFFALEGNHTLGREESRSGHFLDQRDYCKLHIICHYVKVLLGDEFEVIPIGKVGRDEPGKRLLEEMRVSLFAQELKTPFPVSYKRLEKAWSDLAG